MGGDESPRRTKIHQEEPTGLENLMEDGEPLEQKDQRQDSNLETQNNQKITVKTAKKW